MPRMIDADALKKRIEDRCWEFGIASVSRQVLHQWIDELAAPTGEGADCKDWPDEPGVWDRNGRQYVVANFRGSSPLVMKMPECTEWIARGDPLQGRWLRCIVITPAPSAEGE